MSLQKKALTASKDLTAFLQDYPSPDFKGIDRLEELLATITAYIAARKIEWQAELDIAEY